MHVFFHNNSHFIYTSHPFCLFPVEFLGVCPNFLKMSSLGGPTESQATGRLDTNATVRRFIRETLFEASAILTVNVVMTLHLVFVV